MQRIDDYRQLPVRRQANPSNSKFATWVCLQVSNFFKGLNSSVVSVYFQLSIWFIENFIAVAVIAVICGSGFGT